MFFQTHNIFKWSWALGISFLQTIINLKARGRTLHSAQLLLIFSYLSFREGLTIGLTAWPCCISSSWRMARWHTGASFCRAVPTWLTASTTALWSRNLGRWQCQTRARVSLGASCHASRCHVRGILRNKKCTEVFLGNLWLGLHGMWGSLAGLFAACVFLRRWPLGATTKMQVVSDLAGQGTFSIMF